MADRTIKPDDTNDLVLQNNDGSAKIEVNEAQTIVLTGGSTTALTIDTDGDINLTQDIYLASGKGIYFDGGTTSANYLGGSDAYEEGTWSTTISGESNCSSVSLSNATYTKIGRSVTLIGKFDFTFSSGSTLTQFAFTPPFPMVSNTSSPSGAVDGYDGSTNILGSVGDYTSSNNTQMRMIFPTSSVSSGATSGGQGKFSITYFTS